MSILVSINCITYNHEDMIADAIEGFLMQKTNFQYEILIGEDCSQDDTKRIVESYIEKYPDKIRMITSEKNVGARNNSIRLLENSKGKFIAECEGDDYWTDPNKLQRQIDYMTSNPDCSLCFHASEIIQAPNKRTGMIVKPYNESRKSPIEDIIVGGGGFLATGSMVYKKELMENPPEFYLNAPIGDYPMQMLLASQGHAYYIDKNMSAYRKGVKDSWTEKVFNSKDARNNIIKVNEGVIELLEGFNSYTNQSYINQINEVKLMLEFKNHVLKGEITEQKKEKFNYSSIEKMKVRAKIYLRCKYPRLFYKLANYKDTKMRKRLKA